MSEKGKYCDDDNAVLKYDWEKFLRDNRVSPILFKTDIGYPIPVYVGVQNPSTRKIIEEVLFKCGALVYPKFRRINERTVIFVEPGYKKKLNVSIAFKLAYVIDCIEKRYLLDMNSYLLDFSRDKCFFDCLKRVFYKPTRNLQPDQIYMISMDLSSDSDDPPELDQPEHPVTTKKLYTKAEKEAILKFIIAKKGYYRLDSASFYQEMVACHVCPGRTKKSLQSHVLNVLIHHVDDVDYIPPKIKEKIKSYIKKNSP